MSFPLKQNFVKRRTLAGKLAATLAVVTISIIVLLVLLIMNSLVTQHYSKLINESGKVRGGIQRAIKLNILSQNCGEVITTVDYALEELKRMEKKSSFVYSGFDIKTVTIVDEKWTAIKDLLTLEDKTPLLTASEEIWVLTNTLVTYVEKKSIETIKRIYALIFLFFVLVVVLGVVQFITRYIIKDKIEYQAEHDALTGLSNRYYFFREHDKAIDNFLEQYRNFTLLMLDIDHFKNINDTYGHDTGDKALQFIAHSLHKHCRKHDLAVRYGGEEFIVLLQEIDSEGSFNIAERIRTYIEKNSADAVVPMTVSIGICMYKKGYTPSIHIDNADKAMYYAKQSGRNKTADFDSLLTVS
jgi:diguanylate cyclase (GGDEF)-like protein